MRVRRVLSLLVVVALTGLLSGAAGGALPTAEAAAVAAVRLLPLRLQEAAIAPSVPALAPAPVVAAPVVAAPVPAPVVAAPVVARAVAGTPCVSTARACIELSSDRAWLIRGGEVSYGPVPITSGRAGFRTPPGSFTVTFHSRDHISSIYDAPMPYSVFFNGGIAFHQGSLSQQSHGCIHLSRTAAREFFESLERGDVVQVVR
ncbi:L,D-transpeptidase [Pseudonocardia sp. KRD-182]|uniref:L,D-transpeptidase n=2 Tax=Pseudonocardia oceani TaxID=2792013 RepID=A0ABS6UBQ9_9PSEU|nr:L,D-transpeptidase [Pseudonocardia oceani]MBW0124857.1 L,D-transpeptidase [Pseudonocardia oceani]MBW0129684.1 L,D-transpeptidase [Pseudonocardia oceani]